MTRMMVNLRALLSMLIVAGIGGILEIPAPLVRPLSAIAQTPEAAKANADRLLLQGLKELQADQVRASVDFLQQALNQYEKIGHPQGELVSLLGLSEAHDRDGNTSKSKDAEYKAFQRAKTVQAIPEEPLTLAGLSVIYSSLIKKSAKPIATAYLDLAAAKQLGDRRQEPIALAKLGEIYTAVGSPAAGIRFYEKSLEILRTRQDRSTESKVQEQLAAAYLSLGDTAGAIEEHQRGLSRVLKDQPNHSELIQLGLSYGALGELGKANDYYQQAIASSQKHNDPQGTLTALFGQITTYAAQDDFTNALSTYRTMTNVVEAQDFKRFQSFVQGGLHIIQMVYYLNSLGKFLPKDKAPKPPDVKNLSWHPLAIPLKAFGVLNFSFQATLSIGQSSKDVPTRMTALFGMGRLFASQGEYGKAIEYYEKSLETSQSLSKPDLPRQWAALTGLSNAYAALGESIKAAEYYQKSLTISKQLKNNVGDEVTQIRLKNAYRVVGEYDRAIEAYQKSLDIIARYVKNASGEQAALAGLGRAYSSLGDYPKALDFYQSALKLARTQDQNRVATISILMGLGETYTALGSYQNASTHYQESVKLSKDEKFLTGQYLSLAGLGRVSFFQGDQANAIKAYQQQISLLQARQKEEGPDAPKRDELAKLKLEEASAMANLGRVYFFQGKNELAKDLYEKSLTIAEDAKEKDLQQLAISGLGSVATLRKDDAAAIAIYEKGLKLAKDQKNRQAEGAILSRIGELQHRVGKLPEAEKTLYEAIKIRESLREKLSDTEQVFLFETQRSSYNTLQQVLIAQNKPTQALEVAERGRARSFVELLSKQLPSTVPNPAQSAASAQATKQTETAQLPTIATIQQTAKTHNATIVQYSIIYDFVEETRSLETRESELYIWVIKPNGEITFRKSDLKPFWNSQKLSPTGNTPFLVSMVSKGQDEIDFNRNPNRGTTASSNYASLTDLHQILIAPIADILPTDPRDRVMLIPQESLFLIPFAALRDPQGRYLIEKHTLVTAPSIQVLDLTAQRSQQILKGRLPSNAQTALVVGNPVMPKYRDNDGEWQELDPLPGAEAEANQVAKLLKTTAIVGPNATKSAVQALFPNADLIHLATHGLFNEFENTGLPGAMALAPENPNNAQDGLLTSDEILGMNLKANLVVLSACNTGKGKITGDGILGLSRSLMASGVPSVVVSLWSVNDASTAFLMTEFYQHLQKGQDKAQALRQAMLTTLQNPEYNKPYYWAAFTLMGQPG